MKRKNDVSYHMTLETQDHDFTCSCKNAPIPMASVLHSHDGYEIYLFLSGEVRINFENSSHIMKHGDMVLIPPYVFHYSMPLGDSTYNRIVINIKESYMQKKGPAYAHFTDCFYRSDSSRLNLLHLDEAQIARCCDYARSLDQTLREPASAYGRDFLAEALLTTILVFIGRIADSSSRLESRQTPPPAITATFRYIDDHLSESLLLEDIAKQVHLNPVYLTRIFKSYTGMPIQQLFQFFPDLLQASEALTEAVSDQCPCLLLHPEFFRTDVILPVISTEKELPAKGQQLSDQSGSHSVFRKYNTDSSAQS